MTDDPKQEGDRIEGIPLPGEEMPQENSPAPPNRPEPAWVENPEMGLQDDQEKSGEGEPYQYFPDEKQRLNEKLAADDYAKPDERWSPGLTDEENSEGYPSFADLDRGIEPPEAVDKD